MYEEKNDNAEKILHFRILNSAKSTVQTKTTNPKKQTPYLNPGRLWTKSTTSDESMEKDKVTAIKN